MNLKGSSNSRMPQKRSQRKASNPTSRFISKFIGETALGMTVRIVLLTVPFWTVPLIGAKTTTLFSSSFESGLSGWDKQLLCCSDSVQIVSSPTREGSYAAKITHRKSDPKVRAEIRKFDSVSANTERWYGYSVFIPKEYAKDPVHEIITQWSNRPADRDPGEGGRRPSLSLSIRNVKLELNNHWDSRSTTLTRKGVGTKEWDLGPVAKGQWTDLVFHVKWSHKPDGVLEVWKNGRLVVKQTGPNTYNDKTSPSMKIGIYKRQWKNNPEASTTTERTLYYDAVRIGDANASYKDVAPRSCSASSTTFHSRK
jgi:hypothetical protein